MITLTDDMTTRLAGALAAGAPVLAASVDRDGQPKLSFYGSAHVHGSDALAIWVRDPESSVLGRIAANPRMSFLYRHPADRVRWVFEGRARVVDDAAERARVWEDTPDAEKGTDPEQRGRAVVIDLDRVTGRDLLMER